MPWSDVLTFAVHLRDYHTAERLLEDGCPPEGRQEIDIWPLQVAVKNNDPRMVELLINHGANVNRRDNLDHTPLIDSTYPDVDAKITKTLIDAGGQVDIRDKYDRSPVHFLSFYSQVDKMKHCLHSLNVAFVNAVSYFGNSALHLCTSPESGRQEGTLETVQCLLQAGADPNLQDNRGRTALHHLSSTYEPHTISFLKEAENVNYLLKDKDGDNFLHNLLSNLNLTQNYLFDLITAHHLIMKQDWKHLLNDKNECGVSPFCRYLESTFCNETVISKMIELGADVNMPDDLGITPLMRTCVESFELTKVLIEHGADLNATDIYGENAIHLAVNSKIASYLIESGASVNLCDKWGRSPLQQSIYSAQDFNDDEDVQAVILMKGGNINHQDNFGSTVLHHAVYDNSDLLSSFLKMGADKRIRDKMGLTALDIAHREDNKVAENLLGIHTTSDITELKVLLYPDDTEGEKLRIILHDLGISKDVEKALARVGGFENEPPENGMIRNAVNCLVTGIAKTIPTLNEKFAIKLFASGSSSEGTKASLPDEFDFVFCLPFFSEMCEIIEDRGKQFPGFVRLKCISAKPPQEIAHLFDDEGFLLCSELRRECGMLIKRIIKRKATWDIDNIKMGGISVDFERNESEKPVINFTVSWIGMEHKNLDISIDIALGIHKKGWWPACEDTADISFLDATIREMGCLLIAQVPDYMRREGNIFRISCSLCESAVMKDLPQNVKNSYKLAKLLMERICPEIDFGEDEDGRPALPQPASSVITSYLSKNCLLRVVLMNRDNPEYQGSEAVFDNRYVLRLTSCIYKQLMTAALERKLPAYFLPKIDLFNYKNVHLAGLETDDVDVVVEVDQITNQIVAFCRVILGCIDTFASQKRLTLE